VPRTARGAADKSVMGDMTTNLATAFRQAAGELRQDKKKSVILCVLVLVACLVLLRLLLGGTSPADADAADPGATAPADANLSAIPQAPEYHSGTADEQTDMSPRGADGRPREMIVRDLFVPNPDFFPLVRKGPRSKKPAAQSQTQPVTSEEQMRRQIILGQANGQCTMISASPTVIINGRVLQVGGRIGGFDVVGVTPHTCSVRKDGVTVILKMGEQDDE